MTTYGPPDREPVYLGLGSNLDGPRGGRQANLRLSLDKLAQLKGVWIKAASSIYETRPLGPQDQGLFLNAAAELRVARQPEEFL
ncbi:MAG: 2-amino-4-hydroxy-6-hydroxymethyldihydropteridine diphosphokinase, partial [Deltaproteobacteria bacterium]|nr:2-amino-4-hydroxy-6-hydroxymethyldihydropteridine diphosphokinase [Deltaproteobacteria bacterium]